MLVPLDEARAHVLERVGGALPAARRSPPTTPSGGSSAERVEAGEAVPAFDNSAMDGYAVRAADTAGAPVALAGRRHARWPATAPAAERRRRARRCGS